MYSFLTYWKAPNHLLSWFTFSCSAQGFGSFYQVLVPSHDLLHSLLLGCGWLMGHDPFSLYAQGHASLCHPHPGWPPLALPEDPPLALVVPKYLGPIPFFSLGSPKDPLLLRNGPNFPYFLLSSLGPKAYPIMGLGSLLPILNGPNLGSQIGPSLVLRSHLLWILILATCWTSTTCYVWIWLV